MVLAIVGMAGSGKSRLAAHLKSKGFPVVRFGEIVIEELVRRGLDISPRNEQAVREGIRAEEGMDVCARRALPRILSEMGTSATVIVDGLYSFSEYKTLKEHLSSELVVLHVFTRRTLRYERLRARADRPFSVEEAEARDFSEVENIEKGGPIALADHVLLNNGPAADLFAAADDLVVQLDGEVV